MNTRIIILCEDSHGIGFFKELISRFKQEGLISSHSHIDVTKFYGPCNSKLERQLKAMAYLKRCDCFIIIADADGKPIEETKERIALHVPNDLRNKTHIVVLSYEIEEWICMSLGIKITDKPSVLLKHRMRYEKYELRHYVSKLDINKLLVKCRSFCEFIDCLRQARV